MSRFNLLLHCDVQLANRMKSDVRWRKSARPRIERALAEHPGYSVIFVGCVAPQPCLPLKLMRPRFVCLLLSFDPSLTCPSCLLTFFPLNLAPACCRYCMGAHMAQVAAQAFRAPAILFNPAPRINMVGKLALLTALRVPVSVANLATLGLARKAGNVFTSRSFSGISTPATGFWRVLAPRGAGPEAVAIEAEEWFARMTPVPGNGMTVVHAVAGDLKPASYFASKATGYELHAYPSLAERSIEAAHDPKFLALLPLRKDSDKPPTLAFPEPPLQALKDSDAMPIAYVQAGLRIYERLAASLKVPVPDEGGDATLQEAAERGLAAELAAKEKKRREEGVWLRGLKAVGKVIVS